MEFGAADARPGAVVNTPKPKILFAWELGANFGHASNVAEVASGLGDRADVTVAAKAPVDFRRIAPDLDVTLLPAPAGRVRPPQAPADNGLNFADDLRHVGWEDARDLAALLESWRALIRLVKPDLVAAQAAPTAVLAARSLGLPTAMFGYSYDCPPRTTPLPPFYFWAKEAIAGVGAREAAVTATANTALAAAGAAPIESFAALYRECAYLIGSFEEIDAYAPRGQFESERPRYFGQLTTTSVGQTASWREGGTQRLFAYLQPANASTKLALEAFAALPPNWDVIAAVPGLPPGIAQQYSKAHVRLLDGPARLDRLLPDCDIGVSHGSSGMAAVYLAAGLPQVCLPSHAEQVMSTRTLGVAGLSIGLAGRYGAANVRAAILRAAAQPDMRKRCRAVAKRLGRDDLLRPGARIADALLRLV